MKNLVILIFSLFICCKIYLQEQPLISGFYSPEYRLSVKNTEWLWNENRLQFSINKNFEEKARLKSDIWLRTLDNKIIIPEIREAKIELYDFLTDKMDLSFGRQRIKWGTADKLNPTDNINPYDLEDIWDFGRHLSSDAVRLKYYTDKITFDAFAVVRFQTARLPYGKYSNLLTQDFSFPDSIKVYQKTGIYPITLPAFYAKISLNSTSYFIEEPENFMKNEYSTGLRVSTQIKNVDVSVSYLYSYDNFPVPYETNVILDSFNITTGKTYISTHTKLLYPKFHHIGFDFTTSIQGIGFWGEACAFIPDKNYIHKYITPDFNQILSSTFNLPNIDFGLTTDFPEDSSIFSKSDWWIRFIIGGDYTFNNGIYLNFQYLHGFINEYKWNNLNDYYIIRIERKFFNDKLKIAPLNGGFMIGDYSEINNNYAYMLFPEITYYPNINTELTVGCKIIDGKGKILFTKVKDLDDVYLKAKFSF